MTQQEAQNLRDDLDFLTKETTRLNNELQHEVNRRRETEDRLLKTQVECDALHNEAEDLRHLREIHNKEIEH